MARDENFTGRWMRPPVTTNTARTRPVAEVPRELAPFAEKAPRTAAVDPGAITIEIHDPPITMPSLRPRPTVGG